MKLLFVFVLAYVLGSIPFGFVTARRLGGIDIREHGSGNTGATNVFRVLGGKAGLITALGDIFKGVVAVQLAKLILQEPILGMEPSTAFLIAGILVIAGHNWSLFLGFEGGKGVATTVGVLLALLPYLILVLIFVWVPIVYLTRYVSLASVVTGVMIPILMFIFREPGEYLFFGIIIAIFVVYRHRSNIKRLLAGKENRIDFGKKKKKDSRRVR